MVNAFDQRLVQLSLTIDGEIISFTDLDIRAQGTKYAGALKNTCNLRISNLTREQRQYILTQASPIRQVTEMTPIGMKLEVGRQSSGLFTLFEGDVFQGGVTQPPDIGIFLYSLTNDFKSLQTTAVNYDTSVDLQVIAQQVATACGLQLEYQATPRNILNYSFTGSPDRQIKKLNEVGGVIAFVDNSTLVVIDADKPRGDTVRLINANTGMVGVPQPTPEGVNVTMMIDNTIQCGGMVQIESAINPGCNGNFIVRKIDYEVANRDNPFYYTLQCGNPQFYLAGTQ